MKHKILIVEDNESIQENTTEKLELDNFIIVTNDSAAGLHMALKQIPDLILCDIQMPVMVGYHLLEHIRKLSALDNCRFIFYTASTEKKEIERGCLWGRMITS